MKNMGFQVYSIHITMCVQILTDFRKIGLIMKFELERINSKKTIIFNFNDVLAISSYTYV